MNCAVSIVRNGKSGSGCVCCRQMLWLRCLSEASVNCIQKLVCDLVGQCLHMHGQSNEDNCHTHTHTHHKPNCLERYVALLTTKIHHKHTYQYTLLVSVGEAMEQGLRDCCRSIRIGKILIRRDPESKNPRVSNPAHVMAPCETSGGFCILLP